MVFCRGLSGYGDGECRYCHKKRFHGNLWLYVDDIYERGPNSHGSFRKLDFSWSRVMRFTFGDVAIQWTLRIKTMRHGTARSAMTHRVCRLL